MQASFPSHDLIDSGRSAITLSRILPLILFLTLVTIVQASPTYATDLIVQTKSGAVQGVNVGSVNLDCLFLNVSVPVGTTSASSLPVMVHLHGGSNTFNWGYEDAHVFVDQGVIVVTLKTRTQAALPLSTAAIIPPVMWRPRTAFTRTAWM
jgi:hypothetical protein